MPKMHLKFSYRILNRGLTVGLGFLAMITAAQAQQYSPTAPTSADLYCSGVITDKPFPNDFYVISGENSDIKTTFTGGDYVYINQDWNMAESRRSIRCDPPRHRSECKNHVV